MSLCQCLQSYPAGRYLVGYSGGQDSHVLLDLLHQLRATGQLTTPITAIHVNHRLQSVADDWVVHCQAVCDSYDFELIVETVRVKPMAGESIEAFAREQRYKLIKKHLKDGDIFLSAHHQRDQAETFLLQLMRGAGLDGLRAMPLVKAFGVGQYLRPLLHWSYAEIESYADTRQLNFIEDSSNDDTRFNRNYLRHNIFPLLEKRFPQAQAQIAQSAAWLGELPDILAPQTLSVAALQKLTESQQKQQLRAFVKQKTGVSLSQTQTQYVLQHHLTAAPDKHPTLVVGETVIRRFEGEMILTAKLPSVSPATLLQGTSRVGETTDFSAVGQLTWQLGQGLNLPPQTLLQIRPLRGSQRFCPHTRSRSTTVKKLLHEARIPPWLRPFYLGLYRDDELLAIPNIGVAAAYYHRAYFAWLPLWQIRSEFARL